MDLISVIVPVYKVEKYLDKCVESIVNQTYQNLEIILVDDGSPDNCPQMCDDWAKKDNRIKVIHKENGGLSDARNAGMAIATGEYIGFVDSDDYIAPEMYERLLDSIYKEESDISCCSVQMIWEDSNKTQLLTHKINATLDRVQAQKELLYENKLKQPVWYKLYKTSLIKDIPFEKGKYHEDVFWSYQAVGRAKKVSIIDYVGYYYLQRSGSIMGENFSIKRLDSMEALCQRYEYFKKEFPELQSYAKCSILGNCIYFGQMTLKYMTKQEQKKVFEILFQYKEKYILTHKDYQDRKLTHRLWLDLARISLKFTCRVKNILKIGV